MSYIRGSPFLALIHQQMSGKSSQCFLQKAGRQVAKSSSHRLVINGQVSLENSELKFNHLLKQKIIHNLQGALYTLWAFKSLQNIIRAAFPDSSAPKNLECSPSHRMAAVRDVPGKEKRCLGGLKVMCCSPSGVKKRLPTSQDMQNNALKQDAT